MRYFARSEDPFAIANHPWQPTLQHAHVLVAPLLVFSPRLMSIRVNDLRRHGALASAAARSFTSRWNNVRDETAQDERRKGCLGDTDEPEATGTVGMNRIEPKLDTRRAPQKFRPDHVAPQPVQEDKLIERNAQDLLGSSQIDALANLTTTYAATIRKPRA